MTSLPTPSQLVALGLSEIEAHAVVSALVLLQDVPASVLERAERAWYTERQQDPDDGLYPLLFQLPKLRRLLPERGARCHDDKGPSTRGGA